MQNILGTSSRKADLTFRSCGMIEITSRVARLLELRHGDVIDIMTDEGEWYLYVKYRTPIGRHKGTAFQTNRKGHHFRVWSKTLSKAVLGKCGKAEVVRLCVGTPVELKYYGTVLPIIYKYILQ